MVTLESPKREGDIGVWLIRCGGIQHRVAARSRYEAIAWYEQQTGLAGYEYGDVEEVEDLDWLKVSDPNGYLGRDYKGRPLFAEITAREAIRRATSFPTYI
jgi:hypothetical protein